MADWADYYKGQPDVQLKYPSETLVRLLRGCYIGGEPQNLSGKRILEVGFGSGNNSKMMREFGALVSGVEIDHSIAEAAPDAVCDRFYTGTNTDLSRAGIDYDFLVSWNVIHYEISEDDVKRAIKEYARILKTGGRLFLSTTGPEHEIRKGAEHIEGMKYRITLDGDFRKGDVQCFFNSGDLQYYFSKHFSQIKIGRSTHELFGHTLDWYILTAVKP